jgi:ABC-type sugar transport system substrate-binding protein
MKKLLALLLTAVMVAGLFTACAKEEATGTTTDTATTDSATTADDTATTDSASTDDGKIVIGFSPIGAESGWITAETDAVIAAADADPNIELIFSDAQQKQENQIKAIRNFIAQEVDVIALAPVVESGWETVLGEAKEAGIPVVLLDRGIVTEDESLYVTFMGSDFIVEGELAAQYIIDKFGEDAEVNIVELQGTVGASAATDRMTGFASAIAGLSGYEIIKSQTGDFTRSKGKEVMEAFLKSDGEMIDVVYAHNDDMALGAIQAIEEYGLVPGVDIIIVSIDGVVGAFEAIADGKMNCTVECTPLLGPGLMEVAQTLVDGGTVERWIKSNDRVFADEAAVEELPNRVY